MGLRHRRSGVSEVVAIILLVAITVVLTGVLYLVVTDISKQAQVPAPHILLTTTSTAGGVYTFEVSEDRVRPMTEFSMRLWINDSNDVASIMNPLVSGTQGNLTYADRDSGGTVTSGDTVSVQTVPGHKYQLFFLWNGQSLITDLVWTT